MRGAPKDPEARRRLRALAAEQSSWEQLALLLTDEVRTQLRPEIAAAFYEELADVYDNLDQPLETITAMEAVVALEPDDVAHRDRIAWLYRKAGAWAKAADAFEHVARLAQDDLARAALHAAGKLYRDHHQLERAAACYQKIVERRESDVEAWRALDELYTELGKWREVAEVRGALANRASGVDKAALLRAQARAFEQAGDTPAAAALVANAARHAPDDVSGLVDYAMVLARGGKGGEAAAMMTMRVEEAIARGAASDDIAALRSRLASILEDACGDRAGAAAVLDALLADAPGYLPALERLVWHASHDPDPRVHAAALLRHAEALPAGARAATLLEAARKLRGIDDHRGAARAFEAATELLPDDDEIRRELEDERTAIAVEAAATGARGGDAASAERGLRQILRSRPQHGKANLALAELLASSGRHVDAVEHLRGTLAEAPEDTPPQQLAPLAHRYALEVAALGDADEAHNLLHEAHRLDRRSLVIKLALGESCFQRRLWREAALHLGSLHDHPDAAAHASAVAAGLVHAAVAEVRALRPTNAEKRYEAAVRIDPTCAPAWHALGELASERGDLERAAECLEREADATTMPSERLRLFDALGDLAHDVLADPERAERCWTQVAEQGSASVLTKLLALQRARGATIARGETCERLAELARAPKKRAPVPDRNASGANLDAPIDLGPIDLGAPDLDAPGLGDSDLDLSDFDAPNVDNGSIDDLDDDAERPTDRARARDRAGMRLDDDAERPTDRARARADDRAATRPADRTTGGGDGDRDAKALDEEAALAYLAGGDLARARAVAERLVAKYPLDAATITAATTVVLAERDYKRAVAWLKRAIIALGAKADAELWRRFGDAQRGAGDEPAALLAYQRAIDTAPKSDAGFAARRGLVELAAAAGRDARSSLFALVEADQDPAEVLAWARELARGEHGDDACAAYELARGLGAPLTDEDDRFYTAHAPRAMASDEAYGAALDEAERRALVDDPGDAPLGELVEMLGEAAPLICADARTALARRGLADAPRLPYTTATAALYPQIANALGGPQTLLHAAPRADSDLVLLLASPPVIVVGPRLAALRARTRAEPEGTEVEQRFALGRLVELARPRRVFAAGVGPVDFADLVAALAHAFGRQPATSPAIIADAERLRTALPVALRRRLTEKLAAIDASQRSANPGADTPTNPALDPAGYRAACERAADRAGLLACGRVDVAIALVAEPTHLVRLAATEGYLAARRKLRSRRAGV